MSEFKVGERVRVLGDARGVSEGMKNGRVGTVEDAGYRCSVQECQTSIRVRFGDELLICTERDIEHELQLQPGKWYRQRDGGKAYVAAELPEELCDPDGVLDRFLGLSAGGFYQTWRPSGLYRASPGHQFDLIAEWVDGPTDAEITEALRWLSENNKGIDGDGRVIAQQKPSISPRRFVDAVNEYRAREGA